MGVTILRDMESIMREYLVQHRLTGHWSSITIDRDDTHALVCVDDTIQTVAYDTAACILQYARQSGDYNVELVQTYRTPGGN